MNKNEQAALSAALHALRSYSGFQKRWQKLKEVGASDETLLDAIRFEFGIQGGSSSWRKEKGILSLVSPTCTTNSLQMSGNGCRITRFFQKNVHGLNLDRR